MYKEYLLSHWTNVRNGLLETIEKFQDQDLDFKAFPAAWSVRELMLHIAQEEQGEFAYGIAQTISDFPAEYPASQFPTVASVKLLLSNIHAQPIAYLEPLSDADLGKILTMPWGPEYPLVERLGHLIEHEIHHRAELSLILGMLGRQGLDA